MAATAGSSLESEPSRKRMRISTRESMQDVVSAALDHFTHNPTTSLVLSSLPNEVSARSASQSTKALNRLVSIVEIVKREWTRARQSARSKEDGRSGDGGGDGEDAGSAAGTKRDGAERKADRLPTRLHQYNELVCLEDQIADSAPAPDADDLATARERHDEAIERITSGRKRPKKTHSAGLIVTLSLQPLPDSDWAGKSVTHQAPPPKIRLRGRARKRKRKREAGEADEGDEAAVAATGDDSMDM